MKDVTNVQPRTTDAFITFFFSKLHLPSFALESLWICVMKSSIWAQRWPIKCLKGLVRNLLAVRRWGVLEWVTLICDWGDLRTSLRAWDNRNTFFSPQKQTNLCIFLRLIDKSVHATLCWTPCVAWHLRALLPVIFISVLWVCCEVKVAKLIPYVQRSEHVFIYSTLLNQGHIHLWLQRFVAQGKLRFLRK